MRIREMTEMGETWLFRGVHGRMFTTYMQCVYHITLASHKRQSAQIKPVNSIPLDSAAIELDLIPQLRPTPPHLLIPPSSSPD